MAEAMFAKAGKGYNREQVDAFLLELNRNFAEKEKELDARIRQLSAALTETEARLREAEAKNEALEADYSARLAEKERECADLQASIGQRMLQADARAEQILAEAQKKADAITSSVREKAEAECERMLAETRKGCAVIGQAAAEFASRMNAVTAEMNKTEKLMDMALEDVRRKAGIRKVSE
jgi:cell division septum initiation protein DivIVA